MYLTHLCGFFFSGLLYSILRDLIWRCEALYIGMSKVREMGPTSFLAFVISVFVCSVILDSSEISWPPLNFLITHSTILVVALYSTFCGFLL